MAISGLIAGGVQDALDQVLERRLREAVRQQQEKQSAAQLALQRDQLDSLNADRQAGNALQARQIDLADLRRRDDNNARGLDLRRQDRADMDVNSAMETLPPHLKPIAGLFKIGAVGKLSPEDMQSPEDRAAALKAAEEREIRIRRASIAPRQQEERKPLWLRRPDGTPYDANGVAPEGTQPYDAVAARSSQPQNNAEAVDTAREAARLASELYRHKGLPSAFGVIDQYLPTVRQDTQDAINLRDALTGMLTLENMNKMKGVLSDSDMKLLRQASTTLQPGAGDAAAKKELRRIAQVMSKLTGEPDPLGSTGESAPAAPAVDPRVLEMIKKYGGGG